MLQKGTYNHDWCPFLQVFWYLDGQGNKFSTFLHQLSPIFPIFPHFPPFPPISPPFFPISPHFPPFFLSEREVERVTEVPRAAGNQGPCKKVGLRLLD